MADTRYFEAKDWTEIFVFQFLVNSILGSWLEFNFGIQFFISDANVQDIILLFNQIDKQKQGFLDLNCF